MDDNKNSKLSDLLELGVEEEEEKTNNGEEEINRSFHNLQVIFFSEDVDQESVAKLMKKIIYYATQGNKDIFIYIDSNGGSVYDILGLYDLCHSIKNKIHIFVQSRAFSAGAFIAACCATGERRCGKNSSFMIHEVSSMAWGKLSDLTIDTKETKRLNDRLIKLLVKHTNLSKEEVKTMTKKDTYFTSKDALKWGFVDQVI